MLALALLMHNDTHFIVSFSFSMIRYVESFNHELITKQLSSICSFHMQQKIIFTNILICIYTGYVRMYRKEIYRNNSMQMQITTKVSLYFLQAKGTCVRLGKGGGGHSLLTVQNLKIRTKSNIEYSKYFFFFFNIKTYNSLTKNRKIREFIKSKSGKYINDDFVNL